MMDANFLAIKMHYNWN